MKNGFLSSDSCPSQHTSRQDEYSRLSRNASVGVHGYALVFSITSRETFERIEPINEALLNALGDAQDVPRVLVGSMKDLSHQRQVSMQVRRPRMFDVACIGSTSTLEDLSESSWMVFRKVKSEIQSLPRH